VTQHATANLNIVYTLHSYKNVYVISTLVFDMLILYSICIVSALYYLYYIICIILFVLYYLYYSIYIILFVL